MGFEGSRDNFSVPNTVGKWPLSLRKSRVHASRSLREKFMEILDSKYRKIDDHETCMRNFVLLRNCLRRLQREARDDQSEMYAESSPANVSPACLSPLRYPTPVPHTYEAPADTDCSEEHMSPAKRPRLSLCHSRENVDSELKDDGYYRVSDDTDILRDLYETCSNNSYKSSPLPSSWSSAPCLTDPSLQNSNYSLSYSFSSRDLSPNDPNWFKNTCGMNSRCGGEDLRSVVFYSLVSSLES